MEVASLFPTHFLMLEPGLVAMKATTTVMVLANTLETATEKIKPNTGCWRRQDNFPGCPMKRKEERKQSRREMRRVQVRPRLLALTMGVSLCLINVCNTKTVIKEKETATEVKPFPNGSS